MNFARTNKECFENELGTTSERFSHAISNASSIPLRIFQDVITSLAVLCSTLVVEATETSRSEDRNLPLVFPSNLRSIYFNYGVQDSSCN